MSTFVVHPVWPIDNPEELHYGLYRIDRRGEKLLAEGDLAELIRCKENLKRDQNHRPQMGRS